MMMMIKNTFADTVIYVFTTSRGNIFIHVCRCLCPVGLLTLESLDLKIHIWRAGTASEYLGRGHVSRSVGQGQGHTSIAKYTCVVADPARGRGEHAPRWRPGNFFASILILLLSRLNIMGRGNTKVAICRRLLLPKRLVFAAFCCLCAVHCMQAAAASFVCLLYTSPSPRDS